MRGYSVSSKPVTGKQADRCALAGCGHMRRFHHERVLKGTIYHQCSRCGDPALYWHEFKEPEAVGCCGHGAYKE